MAPAPSPVLGRACEATSPSARGRCFSAEFGSCYGSTRPPPAQVGVRGSASGAKGERRPHSGCSVTELGGFPCQLAPLPSRPAPLGRSSAPGAAGEGVTPLRRWVLAKGPRRAAGQCRVAGSRQGLSSAGASSGSGDNQAGCAVPGRVLPGTVSSRFSAALPSLLFIKLECKTEKSSYAALL